MNNETMTTIEGGTEIEVTLANGSKETVKVRQLPVRQMRKYAQVIEDDAAAVELYCDRPPGWSDTLTSESLNAVADLGLDLNADFFRAWFQRRMKIAEALKPGVTDEIQKGLSAALQNPQTAASASPASLQSLPSVAA